MMILTSVILVQGQSKYEFLTFWKVFEKKKSANKKTNIINLPSKHKVTLPSSLLTQLESADILCKQHAKSLKVLALMILFLGSWTTESSQTKNKIATEEEDKGYWNCEKNC